MASLKRRNDANTAWEPISNPLDSSPTSGSDRGVTSGGVYTALQDKEDFELNGAPTALTEDLENMVVGDKTYVIPLRGVAYVTTAPTAANTDGIRVAYLTSEPATKYDGWLYLIKE